MKTKEVIQRLQELDPEQECMIELCDEHFVTDYRHVYQVAWEPIAKVNALIPDEADAGT